MESLPLIGAQASFFQSLHTGRAAGGREVVAVVAVETRLFFSMLLLLMQLLVFFSFFLFLGLDLSLPVPA